MNGGGLFNAGRFFYAGAAAFLVVLMFWGFQLFYLQGRAYPGRPIAPPIRALAIQHAVAMTAWMLLVLAQSLLIAGGKRRVHMTLGKNRCGGRGSCCHPRVSSGGGINTDQSA